VSQAAQPRPTVQELRRIAQPESTVGRASAEHWAGRLYMRYISIYLTRLLVPTRVTPNAVTWLMLLCGPAASAVLAVPKWWTAVIALLLIQLQGYLDCVDGELARWRRQTGPVGIYVDRLAHWVTDSSLVIAVGVRADGGYSHIGGWTALALLGAWLVLIGKGETELVHVARFQAGLPPTVDTTQTAQSNVSWLRRARSLAGTLPFNRLLLAMELTAAALIVAIIDAARSDHAASRVLVVVLLADAAIVAVVHLAAILTSARMRA
jgi:phosphatidylglycerophosphate synthase